MSILLVQSNLTTIFVLKTNIYDIHLIVYIYILLKSPCRYFCRACFFLALFCITSSGTYPGVGPRLWRDSRLRRESWWRRADPSYPLEKSLASGPTPSVQFDGFLCAASCCTAGWISWNVKILKQSVCIWFFCQFKCEQQKRTHTHAKTDNTFWTYWATFKQLIIE